MKKIIVFMSILLCILGCTKVFAANESIISNETESKLVEIKEKQLKTLDDYINTYGSDTYGWTAFILHGVQVYSIPIGFIAIALAAIYQYVIGIRKLDVQEKGFTFMIASITLIVICQVLPLVFAVVVKGWRG